MVEAAGPILYIVLGGAAGYLLTRRKELDNMKNKEEKEAER